MNVFEVPDSGEDRQPTRKHRSTREKGKEKSCGRAIAEGLLVLFLLSLLVVAYFYFLVADFR